MVFEAMNPNYKSDLPREWWVTGYQVMPADEIIEKIKSNDPFYTVMDMSERQLQGSRCEILAEAMMNNQIISEVDFRGNGFDADGLFALVQVCENRSHPAKPRCAEASPTPLAHAPPQAFKTMPRLTKINLRGNCCRNEGVEALGKWLSTNKTVTALNLNENYLGDSGAKCIAEMLKVNRTLKHVDISLNTIHNDGAKEIAAALAVNKTVTMLSISGNEIEDKDLRKACRARNDGSTFTTPCEAKDAPWRSTKVDELQPVDFDKVKPPPKIEEVKK